MLDYDTERMKRYDADDRHSHTCKKRKCGKVWKHKEEDFGESWQANTAAHTCPGCGREEYWKDEVFNPEAVQHPEPQKRLARQTKKSKVWDKLLEVVFE